MKKLLLIIICCFIATSCSVSDRLSRVNKKEVFINDNYRTTKEGDILIDDRDFEHSQTPIFTSRAGFQETPKSSTDNSQISVMIDGFGNKTETRLFSNHPLLQRIVVRTFVNGQKKVFVYGNNGDVKHLPPNMMDKVMTASANTLAKSAGIFNGRDSESEPYFLATLRSQTAKTPVPLPGDKFSVVENVSEQTQENIPKQTRKEDSTAVNQQNSVSAEPEPKKDYQSEINKILLQTTRKK